LLIYNNHRIKNTNACKNAIPISKNVTANVIIHGNINIIEYQLPNMKILNANDINICCKICPESIFANNRIVKLRIRAKYDTVSKKIKNHANTNGSPFGMKRFKKFHL